MSATASSADTYGVDAPNQTLTLWDSRAYPPDRAERIYRWTGYAEKDSIHSLLRYVETHRERLRHRYLAWIHDLGESRVNGKRLIDNIAFEDGLSYWWMTLLVEKSPYKSPITDAIRLLALEEIILQQKPEKLRLVSTNRILHETLSSFCQMLGVAYEWERLSGKPLRQLSLRRIYRALPDQAQALISLVRYLMVRRPFRHAEKTGWFAGKRALFVCSYFDNIDPKAAKQGYFHSYYWEGLHAFLDRIGCKSNWLHLFIACGPVPTPHAAMGLVNRFNQQRRTQGFHTFPDAYLSWRIVLRVLKRWFKLNFISWRLTEIQHAFHPRGSQLSLWPLMRGDWEASMRGSVAISNLMWIELFDAALHELPHQKRGLYLCENQAWERALIHAWRKHDHGQLVAVPHGAVRFWHLSYFADPRTVRSADPYPMPQADLTALNGKAAIDAYLSVDYPKSAIVESEALRYSHLIDLPGRNSSKKTKGDAIRVLILCDYLPSSTVKTLQLLGAAAPQISAPITYTVKPHPNFMVKPADYPSLHLNVVMDPLGGILHCFDIAYSSNMTSAAVEAYIAGLPVVVMLDETALNFSLLHGQHRVRFVSTPEELAEALRTAGQGMATNCDHNEFFFLDPNLPRWSRLLES